MLRVIASSPKLTPELRTFIELHIDHGNVERVLGERCARFLHIHRDENFLGTRLPEDVLDDGGDQELVFDHQDPASLQRPGLPNRLARPGAARGIGWLRGAHVNTWTFHRGLDR